MFKFINLDYLRELSDGNEEFMKDMMQTFLSKAPEYIEEFQSLNESKDWEAMLVFAHKSKSTFKMMGSNKLSDDSARIELFCKEGNKEREIGETLSVMKTYFDSVIDEMRVAIQQID